MHVFCKSCQVCFKVLHVCKQMHKKFVCTACTVIAVIITSNSERYFMGNLTLMLIQKHYSNSLHDCHHQSNNYIKVPGDKHVLVTLNY